MAVTSLALHLPHAPTTPTPSPPTPHAPRGTPSFFAHYDSDNSGGLEKQEFVRLIRGFGVTMTASESEALIEELANDADEADVGGE